VYCLIYNLAYLGIERKFIECIAICFISVVKLYFHLGSGKFTVISSGDVIPLVDKDHKGTSKHLVILLFIFLFLNNH